jgi:hypothetical protein
LPADLFDAAIERGKSLDFNTVVTELLSEMDEA